VSSATLNRKKLKAKKVLLIIDDAISESTFINSPSFLKIFIQGLHTSVWPRIKIPIGLFGREALWYLGYGDVPIVHEGMGLCLHLFRCITLSQVPRSVRLQCTHIAMFPSRKTEIDRLHTEHGTSACIARHYEI